MLTESNKNGLYDVTWNGYVSFVSFGTFNGKLNCVKWVVVFVGTFHLAVVIDIE